MASLATVPAHLHPVALRSTALASSSRAAAASMLAEATLRGQHLDAPPPPPQVPLPPVPESLPTPPTRSSPATPRPVPSRHTSLPKALRDHPAAVMGVSTDPTTLPSLTLREANGDEVWTDIRLVTAQQYVDMHSRYLASAADVDESMVFPWLHCCDQPGTPQAAYFGSRGKDAPRYRGLTVITADSEAGPRRASVHSNPSSPTGAGRPRTHSTGSRSTASSVSLESAVSSLFDGSLTLDPQRSERVEAAALSPTSSMSSFQGPEPRSSLLTSSVFPRDVLAVDHRSGQPIGQFLTPKLPANVNLRLFKHQTAKYATVSDIVVYSEEGLCEASVCLAELVREAQLDVFHQRGGEAAGAVQYQTFIVSDKFETFEEQFGECVAVDGWGWRRNKVDFVEREREEMCALTKATEFAHNVWLGNSSDAPALVDADSLHQRVSTSHSSSSLATTLSQLDDGNSLGFAVCIEAHDQAKMPSSSLLSSHSMHLEELEAEVSASDARCTVLKTESGEELLRPPLDDVTHLETVSTGQVCSSMAQFEQLIERTVELCAWLRKLAKGKPGQLGKRVLVYCHDGYTESSLFALAYTMWDRECSLPDAYLHLQLERTRSFFVYPADVALLQRIETRMESIRKAERMEVEDSSTISTTPTQTPRRTFLGGRVAFGLSSHKPSPTPSIESTIPAAVASTVSSRERHAWFYDDRFDGHFPSRILPHVYLGNLNHASNALMLKALSITHVVSMGESVLVPPKTPGFPLAYRRVGGNGGQGINTNNSLWTEWKAGRVQVLDMKGVADDGVDSIKPHVDRALEFMDECRKSGGKVLVHCRVGVSRSASIVIAYVMQYLKMDLISAYLMVRSRRLNILIQPNLLFMWALRRWEAELVASSEEGGERKNKMVTWSHFAREVAELNQRYLC